MAACVEARVEPVCERNECSPFDIGLVYKDISGFSAQEKFRFIENIWKPSEIFDFPVTVESGKSRKFVSSWSKKYPWLAYSKFLDGAFCLPCVCFGVRFGSNACKLDKLYKSPLTRWTSAAERLAAYSNGKSEVHNFADTAMQNFLTVMRRGAAPIDQQMNEALRQRIAQNREILKSLLKTIIFCGRNNIALRGQRDDDHTNTNLIGNFQALLEFRVDSGDQTLQQYLGTALN